MTQIAVTLPENEIESLEKFYTFRNRAEILEFLAQYAFLLPVLLEAPEKIRPYFADNELVLEVTRDPEIVDYVQLFLKIIIEDDTDEAIDKALDTEEIMSYNWYLNLPNEVGKVFWCGVE